MMRYIILTLIILAMLDVARSQTATTTRGGTCGLPNDVIRSSNDLTINSSPEPQQCHVQIEHFNPSDESKDWLGSGCGQCWKVTGGTYSWNTISVNAKILHCRGGNQQEEN